METNKKIERTYLVTRFYNDGYGVPFQEQYEIQAPSKRWAMIKVLEIEEIDIQEVNNE